MELLKGHENKMQELKSQKKIVKEMEFVKSHESIKMQELKSQKKIVREMNPLNASSRHKISKSFSDEKERKLSLDSSTKAPRPKLDNGNIKRNSEPKKKVPVGKLGQTSLRQEILELEKRLKDQTVVRGALEKALGYNNSLILPDSSMPNPTNELIREISILEFEVKNLEQYLLSLYRKAFDQQIPNFSPKESHQAKLNSAQKNNLKSQSKNWNGAILNAIKDDCCVLDRGVNRTSSSLSQRAVCSARISPSEESLARAMRSFHSQPFSFLEEGENDNPCITSLAEYLGTTVPEPLPSSPNKLSEELLRLISGIFIKLSDPPLVHHAPSPPHSPSLVHRAPSPPHSPASSFSSTSAFSPQFEEGFKREGRLDERLINPFRVEGLKEFSGPYSGMVEVAGICREQRRVRDVHDLLQSYKSILCRLETVDPRKLSNDEKIAFWINIHNALLMHAYLEYGIPQNNMKKTSLLMKAKCNIGGKTINAAMIQGLILGCHTYCPGQWFRTLLYTKLKSKGGNECQNYSIDQSEPLLRFALCSGSHSDPAVRVYTPKRIFQQLESSKEEYIRATVGIWKEQKILLPKLVESYAKEIKLSSQNLVEMVQRYLPETLRMAMQRCQRGKSSKIIEWVNYNLNFRYLLARDLAFPHLN